MKALRLIFGAVLLVGLVVFAGADELISSLAELNARYVIALVALSVVMIWASSMKWQTFVRAMGHEASVLALMKLYTLGYFFNVFTPASIGGDVVRSYHLGAKLESQRYAAVATFLERFTGLLAMALLGVLFVLVGSEVTAGLEYAIFLVGAAPTAVAVVCFLAPLNRFTFNWMRKLFVRLLHSEKRRASAYRILEKLEVGMAAARADKMLLLKGLLWSVVFHALTVVNTYVAALAVGWDSPSIAGLFVVVPLVLLVSMVPITPNGVGIQEGAFVFLLERIGGTRAQGLGVGIVLRAKVMLIALVGWAIWVSMGKRKIAPEQTKAI